MSRMENWIYFISIFVALHSTKYRLLPPGVDWFTLPKQPQTIFSKHGLGRFFLGALQSWLSKILFVKCRADLEFDFNKGD